MTFDVGKALWDLLTPLGELFWQIVLAKLAYDFYIKGDKRK